MDGILVDTKSGAVMVWGIQEAALVEIASFTPGIFFQGGVQFPNYSGFWARIFLRFIARQSPLWSWGAESRTFSRTRQAYLTNELREQALILQAKYEILKDIIYALTFARQKILGAVPFQEAVYLAKRLQAERFAHSGYPEDQILRYPYVLHYADHAHLSPQEAADAILMKAGLDDELLSKTELMRLRFFQQIKEAASLEQLRSMREEFFREYFLNAKV